MDMVHVGVFCVGRSICAHLCGDTFTYNTSTHMDTCIQKSGTEVEFPTPFPPPKAGSLINPRAQQFG